MADSTILTAAAALRAGKRAGLAAGARRNADTESDSRPVASFWLALAVLLEDPGQAPMRGFTTAAADLNNQERAILASVLGRSSDRVTDRDPTLAELWNQCRRVLLDAGDDDTPRPS